jgi:CheY-like chemotaxis protein
MYSESLRADGFELRTASNGKDALRTARTFLPSVIVTDLRLHGGIDGLELIRQLRADNRTEEIPIIMLTGATFGDERERAEASDIDAIVIKPCLPDMLASEIRRVSRQPSGVL